MRFVTIRFTMHACIYTYYYSYFSTVLACICIYVYCYSYLHHLLLRILQWNYSGCQGGVEGTQGGPHLVCLSTQSFTREQLNFLCLTSFVLEKSITQVFKHNNLFSKYAWHVYSNMYTATLVSFLETFALVFNVLHT